VDFEIVTSQDYFYLGSAVELAALAIEEEQKSEPQERRYAACVVGAITCSTSFVECTINGLYQYAQSPARNTKFHRALASVCSEAFERLPIIAKYQLALTPARRDIFSTGSEPYQSVNALIELRNAIAHPKEIRGSHKNQQRLERSLNGKYKFGPQREYCKEFFPDRCLSADCAVWAAKSAVRFTIDFKRRLPPTAYIFGPKDGVEHSILERLNQIAL
jgi:hypothetical protein